MSKLNYRIYRLRFSHWIILTAVALLFLFVGVLIMPQRFTMPVHGADKNSYKQESFWYYPWGRSGTHKGVDIFAREGTSVVSATSGIVISSGFDEMGGNYIVVLGPRWRTHYYAHLQKIETRKGNLLSRGERIGTVGTSGNAKGKSPHLHYSVSTLIPYPWRRDKSPQGWKKMYYLDPTPWLNAAVTQR